MDEPSTEISGLSSVVQNKTLMLLSICIPTYNRADRLDDCLNSIVIAGDALCRSNLESYPFEVCVADNCSSDRTSEVVENYKSVLSINYHRHSSNLGIPRNFLKVVDLAQGEFCWLLGDDDLVTVQSLSRLFGILIAYPDVSFVYGNAYQLSIEWVDRHIKPFDTRSLPSKMKKFSDFDHEGEIAFRDLIRPDVSFDFLGGMYLSVFRRDDWMANKHVLDRSALSDGELFSHFDNTFPHVHIFASAFLRKHAYFTKEPLAVTLHGARNWSSLYPMIVAVRLVEATLIYRAYGLPFIQYIQCRNNILSSFLPYAFLMLLNPKRCGLKFLLRTKTLWSNFFFPNLYLSPIFFFVIRIKRLRELFSEKKIK